MCVSFICQFQTFKKTLYGITRLDMVQRRSHFKALKFDVTIRNFSTLSKYVPF